MRLILHVGLFIEMIKLTKIWLDAFCTKCKGHYKPVSYISIDAANEEIQHIELPKYGCPTCDYGGLVIQGRPGV